MDDKVESLLADWVRRSQEGDAPPFEEFCRQHPQQEQRLRTLHERFLRIDRALAPEEPGGAVDQQVGPYRLLERIGSGGMGTVFRAARADGAYEQEVALKRIRHGLDSDETQARFLQERQLLARLVHPHIARLLDGGVDEFGAPYLVMELVRGEVLTAYCDRRQRTVDQRLELVDQVCRAVHYAHQNLVVHRDLKPQNILVEEGAGGEPVVKLLDFGIAKVLEGRDEDGVATETGVRPLTPRYAAPEQVLGRPVTTATDVYAIGVLTYELLTGCLPHRITTLADAWVQHTEDTAPSRPSRAYEAGGPDRPGAPALARSRGTTPRELRGRLEGDLDAILMKALRRDPARRYASVEELRRDLERHRLGFPVEARPDGVVYRARLFVRRHRVGAAAVLATTLSLTVGLGAALVQAQRAEDNADLAEQGARVAREETAAAEQISSFLIDLFEGSRPSGEAPTLADLLDRGRSRVDELADRPDVHGRMLFTLGETYRLLGDYETSSDLLQRALDLERELYEGHGQEPPERRVVRRRAAARSLMIVRKERSELAAAAELLQEVLDLSREHFPETLDEQAQDLSDLGSLAVRTGELDVAEDALGAAVELWESLDPDDEHYARAALFARANLAVAMLNRGKAEAAVPHFERVLEALTLTRGERDPAVIQTMANLGDAYGRCDRFEEAEERLTTAHGLAVDVFGADNLHTVLMGSMLGAILIRQGDLDRARRTLEDAFDPLVELLGGTAMEVLNVRRNLASIDREEGEFLRAESELEDVLGLFREHYPEHTSMGLVLGEAGRVQLELENHDRAVALLREAREVLEQRLDPTSINVIAVRRWLARSLAGQGTLAEAEQLLRETLETTPWEEEREKIRGELAEVEALARAAEGEGG